MKNIINSILASRELKALSIYFGISFIAVFFATILGDKEFFTLANPEFRQSIVIELFGGALLYLYIYLAEGEKQEKTQEKMGKDIEELKGLLVAVNREKTVPETPPAPSSLQAGRVGLLSLLTGIVLGAAGALLLVLKARQT